MSETDTRRDDALGVIQQFYDLIFKEDLAAAMCLLHEDLVIHEPPGLPYGGEFHGIEGWRDIITRADEWASHEILAPIEWLPCGDAVTMVVKTRFTSKTS